MVHTRFAAFMAWFITSLFYAYQYILRVLPGIIMPDVLERFSIDAATYGQFSGAYYIGYALVHIPLGIMLDRFGPKKILPLYMTMTIFGMAPLIVTSWWIYPIIGRFFVGLGSSAAILGTIKIIRYMFPASHFSRMLSFSFAIGLFGAMYGGSPLNYVLTKFGYEVVIIALMLCGGALGVLMYMFIPDMPTYKTKSVRADVMVLLTSGTFVLVSICAGLMMGPLEGFADVWGSGFLKHVYAIDPVFAASLPSFIFLGMCFGGPVISFIAEKSKAYIPTIIGAAACMVIAFIALIGGWVNISLLSIIFLIIGICCGEKVLVIHIAPWYAPKELVGLASAVANMIIMIFGYFFHASIGFVVNAMGGTAYASAYQYGIAVIPVGLCMGILGYLLVWLTDKKKRGNGNVVQEID